MVKGDGLEAREIAQFEGMFRTIKIEASFSMAKWFSYMYGTRRTKIR
jgi:hypothetical protein